jgi:phosphoribosylanthranilate isomerase
MWIKICGITSADAVAAAAEARVDAIGFVFAPSPRQVTPGQAAQLAALAPPGILRIAVAQHPLQMKVDEICRILKPDYFQTDVEDLRELKIPAHVKVLPVVRFGRKTPNPLPARMLFEGPTSGIGELADWGRAAELARQTELILAGGLSAQNVTEAIQAVRPFGVDVSSGVEEVPGIKDPAKIHEFVRAARAAAARRESDSCIRCCAAIRRRPAFPTPAVVTVPLAGAMFLKPWCLRSIGCKRVSSGICTAPNFRPSSVMSSRVGWAAQPLLPMHRL